jgi:hypothetical protein
MLTHPIAFNPFDSSLALNSTLACSRIHASYFECHSRNKLKQLFRTLVERGTLDQHGSGRGVWYDLR